MWCHTLAIEQRRWCLACRITSRRTYSGSAVKNFVWNVDKYVVWRLQTGTQLKGMRVWRMGSNIRRKRVLLGQDVFDFIPCCPAHDMECSQVCADLLATRGKVATPQVDDITGHEDYELYCTRLSYGCYRYTASCSPLGLTRIESSAQPQV